jgi:hypothetical protein
MDLQKPPKKPDLIPIFLPVAPLLTLTGAWAATPTPRLPLADFIADNALIGHRWNQETASLAHNAIARTDAGIVLGHQAEKVLALEAQIHTLAAAARMLDDELTKARNALDPEQLELIHESLVDTRREA